MSNFHEVSLAYPRPSVKQLNIRLRHTLPLGILRYRLVENHYSMLFVCTNHDCTRKKKSIRAIVVFNFIYKLLENGVGLTEDDYQYYYDNLTGQADKRRLALRTDINSKEAALKATKRRSKEIGLKLIDYKQDSPVWKVNNE